MVTLAADYPDIGLALGKQRQADISIIKQVLAKHMGIDTGRNCSWNNKSLTLEWSRDLSIADDHFLNSLNKNSGNASEARESLNKNIVYRL